jgi:hypothetical protein
LERTTRIEELSPKRVAQDLQQLWTNEGLTVFVGSFVSAKSPTSLPMAQEMKLGLVRAIWERAKPVLPSSVRPVRLSQLTRSGFADLPLELIVDEVLQRTGIGIDQLLEFMRIAPPNLNHRVLATLLDRGIASVMTTNFDELIERSQQPVGRSARLTKLHGTISNPESLVARVGQVGRGRSSTTLRKRTVEGLRHGAVCFLGYSGTDLDIGPILKTVQTSTVIWLIRPRGAGESVLDLSAAHDHLTKVMPVASTVRVVSVDGEAVLDELGAMLAVSSPVAGGGRGWLSTLRSNIAVRAPEEAALALGRILFLSGRADRPVTL